MALCGWELPSPNLRLRLKIVDAILCFFLFTPLTILYWHGTVGILDIILLDYFPTLGACCCCAVGLAVQISDAVWHDAISCRVQRMSDFEHVVATRVYIYVYSMATVCHSRGLQQLCMLCLGPDSNQAPQILLASTLILCGLRATRILIRSPLCVYLDTDMDDLFQVSNNSQQTAAVDHALEALATVGVIKSAGHLYWISAWNCLDHLIFPNNLLISTLASWAIGYGACALLLSLETRLKQVCVQLEAISWVLVAVFQNVFYCVSSLACILAWKGSWQVYDVMARHFPIYNGDANVTAIHSNMVAFFLLCLSYTSSSLVIWGADALPPVTQNNNISSFRCTFFGDFLDDQIDNIEGLQLNGATEGLDPPLEPGDRWAGGEDEDSASDTERDVYGTLYTTNDVNTVTSFDGNNISKISRHTVANHTVTPPRKRYTRRKQSPDYCRRFGVEMQEYPGVFF